MLGHPGLAPNSPLYPSSGWNLIWCQRHYRPRDAWSVYAFTDGIKKSSAPKFPESPISPVPATTTVNLPYRPPVANGRSQVDGEIYLLVFELVVRSQLLRSQQICNKRSQRHRALTEAKSQLMRSREQETQPESASLSSQPFCLRATHGLAVVAVTDGNSGLVPECSQNRIRSADRSADLNAGWTLRNEPEARRWKTRAALGAQRSTSLSSFLLNTDVSLLQARKTIT